MTVSMLQLIAIQDYVFVLVNFSPTKIHGQRIISWVYYCLRVIV